jgi:hypothetical protein
MYTLGKIRLRSCKFKKVSNLELKFWGRNFGDGFWGFWEEFRGRCFLS